MSRDIAAPSSSRRERLPKSRPKRRRFGTDRQRPLSATSVDRWSSLRLEMPLCLEAGPLLPKHDPSTPVPFAMQGRSRIRLTGNKAGSGHVMGMKGRANRSKGSRTQ